MSGFLAQSDVACWWCGKPADDDATIEVGMEKKEIISRTTRVEKFRTYKNEIPIFRCNQCKTYQEPDSIITILSIATIFIVGGACYLGYLIQGGSGWMMYTFGIITFILLMGLMVTRMRRIDKRMPEEYHIANAKKHSDHPLVEALKKDGWSEKYAYSNGKPVAYN